MWTEATWSLLFGAVIGASTLGNNIMNAISLRHNAKRDALVARNHAENQTAISSVVHSVNGQVAEMRDELKQTIAESHHNGK